VSTPAIAGPAEPPAAESGRPGFTVTLPQFCGPFDLLLSLIAKHQLDVTELALAEVADDFIAHVRAAGFDLDAATEFLVVAATLLDLKVSRLLPTPPTREEEDDFSLLESRDLLFARLLQYRAYKKAAALLSGLQELETRFVPRQVRLEERYLRALPELALTIDATGLSELASRLRAPRPVAVVATDHVHAPRVDVAAHSRVVVERLLAVGTASFRSLCTGCTETIEVVARFLALLELYREGRVAFEQVAPLGDLTVRWVPS